MNLKAVLALDYVAYTNTTVFLTGKAGTGKTTLLQQIKQETKKNLAVVAPTGVAAINAGGMTIHSFFQIAFGPLIPGGDSRPEMHYSPEKKELLYNLELLILDEVSMVRPDVLDHIDLILRNVKESSLAFGGVQLLLIGDLSQLSPIIRGEEWEMLSRFYNSPYFFSSLVLQKIPYVRIELDHVYRQKEQEFVDILNGVRNQSISSQNLALLNERFQPGFRPSAEDPYITLTTHNSIANQINTEYLDNLDTALYEFKATIRGDFPKDAYPTETELKLKIGSQVMFVKNDTSAEKKFYNGKIGTVACIEENTVFVQCDEVELAVEAQEWSNIKYQLEDDQISETNAGSFAQVPLKLAWAITIHKSQGLTFDKTIIDVSEAFAHGQAYVALSRCRSLAGMILRNPISAQNIISDPAVIRFNEQSSRLHTDTNRLKLDRCLYESYLLSELFDFNGLKKRISGFENLLPGLENKVLVVAEKSRRQLKLNEQERIKKAAIYFLNELKQASESLNAQLPQLLGTSKEGAAKADRLLQWLMTRMSMMEYFSTSDFDTDIYLNVKKEALATKPTYSYVKALNAKPNNKLYEQILDWRDQKAQKEKLMPNGVFSERAAAIIAEKLPPTIKALSAIKGIGLQKASQYGQELILMIRAYDNNQSGSAKDQVSMF
ncbi:HRDC domain-containing protein [Mucilaginibacter sp.]